MPLLSSKMFHYVFVLCCCDGWCLGWLPYVTILILIKVLLGSDSPLARQGIQVLCMLAWVLSGGNQDYGTNLRESFWSPGCLNLDLDLDLDLDLVGWGI